jgi:hypothetical protein
MNDTPDDNSGDAERRLIIILSIIAAVTAIGVGVLLRELYYGAYPHLRPQAPISAGSVETCNIECVLRRVVVLENRMDAVEGKR